MFKSNKKKKKKKKEKKNIFHFSIEEMTFKHFKKKN